MPGFRLSAIVATAATCCWLGGAHAAEPVRIGVAVTLSSADAGHVKDGLAVARQLIADTGGVLGRPVELAIEDTGGVPKKAAAAVEALIGRKHVAAIIGLDDGPAALAAIEAAHRHHIPYLNADGAAAAIRAKAYPEVFSIAADTRAEAEAAVATFKALGAKSVVAFAEKSDFGQGLATALGAAIKASAPDMRFSAVMLAPTAKDFTPAMTPLHHDLPDVFVSIMQPPAAYDMINQVYEDGIAPSARTYFYDAAGLADYPDFWAKLTDAGNDLIFGDLYHPGMTLPLLGKEISEAYAAKTGNPPGRLLFPEADALFVLADAIKRAGSTKAEPLIKALEATNLPATRGTIAFAKERGPTFHQWLGVPFVTYQFTKEDQTIGDATLIDGPSLPFDKGRVYRATTY
jgi:branched-chain amino acid transport system substrate-binding protein